uniref:R3H domain and coiled-coil containing 1 n=1 Tax=Oryzias sinensis TaxID=183150 RepID=A0A8C7WU30_9TELE
MALLGFDDIYLSKEENQFVDAVMEELETYQAKSNPKSVLLFPPLPSRLRFLIHKIAEGLPHLATFSVGENWWRRVVVCFSELRYKLKKSVVLQFVGHISVTSFLRIKVRHLWSCGSIVIFGLLGSGTGAGQLLGPGFVLGPRLGVRCPVAPMTVARHGRARLSCGLGDLTLGSPILAHVRGWATPIKAHLKEAECVSVHPAHNDYSAYESLFCSDHFHHVIEIYDFPVAFQTQDLLNAFTDYRWGQIKWVDDTHALGVFSSEDAGENERRALKTRGLSEGSKRAQRTFLQPVKERPKTDSAVARRMVARALGLPGRDRGRGPI